MLLPQTTKAEDVDDLLALPEPEPSLSEMRMAVTALFFEDPRALDVRHLWTRGQCSYFRVNWWLTATRGSPRIRRSAFVAVETHPYGYRVRDMTPRQAA